MNARMPELKRCFEGAGFTNVKTVLSSGNVVFDAKPAKEATLERKIEQAMQADLKRTFHTVVRPVAKLRAMLERDPYAGLGVDDAAKRVVTFFRAAPKLTVKLPIERDGARLVRLDGRELFTAYLPSPLGPVFMVMIEKTFGTDVTTRTWATVAKCAAA